MPYCPNCGGHVGWGDDSCSMCGESLDGDDSASEQQSPGGRERDPATERQGRQPRRERDRGSTSERRDHRSRREGDERAPPARLHREDAQDRRTAIKYGLGVLGLMVVGAFGLEFVREDDPEDAVEAWRTAWVEGDTAAYRDLWHSESPAREGGGDRFRPEPDSDLQYIPQERTVLDRADGAATIRDVFLLDHPEFETRRLVTDIVDLRTEDGDWVVWDYRTEAVGPVTDCDRSFTITGGVEIECE